MARILFAAAALAAIASVHAQPIPVYKSQEDYCYHNPDMPTCIKGKPLDMTTINKGVIFQPKPEEKNTPARTKAPAPAAAPRSPQQPSVPAAVPQYRIPQARRVRGAPADIRLGELDWRLLQNDPDMLIGLNMAGLAESELARTLIGQWAGKLGATDAEQTNLLAALADVPQAVISIQHKEIVAVLTGRVDSFPERASLGGLQSMRVTADTVALGTPNGLKWAIWRLNFPLSQSASILEGQQLAASNDFWIWGKPQAFAAVGQGLGRNTPISKIKVGVSFKDQFRMDMLLEANDPGTAAKLLEAMQKGAPRGMTAGVEGSAVHLALVMDRDTALQRFAGFMTDPIGKQFAPLLSAARQIAARQASSTRSAPGKIVIDGLDDGPREIPAVPRR
jgi:hypothetical protein